MRYRIFANNVNVYSCHDGVIEIRIDNIDWRNFVYDDYNIIDELLDVIENQKEKINV